MSVNFFRGFTWVVSAFCCGFRSSPYVTDIAGVSDGKYTVFIVVWHCSQIVGIHTWCVVALEFMYFRVNEESSRWRLQHSKHIFYSTIVDRQVFIGLRQYGSDAL